MKIFVTGGTGFLGRHVVAELRARGHRLLVLSRSARQRERGVEFVRGDLAAIVRWRGVLKKFKPEAAIHLAWEGIPDFSATRCANNLIGGLNLISALGEAGCRKIIAIGSCFEYGNVIGKISEEQCIRPHNAFSAAKHSLHIMGRQIAHEKDMAFVWLRPFYIYGPGQRKSSVIPFIIDAAKNNLPPILKTPLMRNDFVYTGDVAAAILDAVKNGKDGGIYNIGSGKPIPIKKIAEIIYTELAGREGWLRVKTLFRGASSGGFYADLAAARHDLGWRPKTTLKAGIKKTISEDL